MTLAPAEALNRRPEARRLTVGAPRMAGVRVGPVRQAVATVLAAARSAEAVLQAAVQRLAAAASVEGPSVEAQPRAAVLLREAASHQAEARLVTRGVTQAGPMRVATRGPMQGSSMVAG